MTVEIIHDQSPLPFKFGVDITFICTVYGSTVHFVVRSLVSF